MTTLKHPDPDAFDLAAWIQGATAPERQVTIFQRGDLAGELARIETDLSHLAQKRATDDLEAAVDEESVADHNPEEELQARRDTLKEQLLGSALTLVVRSLSHEARTRISETVYGADTETARIRPTQAQLLEESVLTISEAIIARIDSDGKRAPLVLTVDETKALLRAIGQAQESKINAAYNAALSESLELEDPGFLPKR